MTAASRWSHKDSVVTFILISFALGLALGLWLNVQDERIDLWDKAAAVGDVFTGHDITEGHHVEGDWVKWSNADIGAAVANFIDYRAWRYGETWCVTGGSCGGRIVERVIFYDDFSDGSDPEWEVRERVA